MVRPAIGLMFAVTLLWSLHAAAQGADVRLVIDVSGSMKIGDPEYLRQDVLNDLVEMLPPGSRAGVWTFGSKANMVVPHGVIDDGWRRAARAARSNIGSVALRTNLADALQNAAWDAAAVSSDWDRHVVLVSDGRVDLADDPAANAAQRQWILNDLLPRLRAANIRLDCLALSTSADQDFLKRLAEATGGYAGRADTVAGVRDYLSHVVTGAAASPLQTQGTLIVPEGAAEVTVFAQHGDGEFVLTTPANERVDASTTSSSIRWADSDGVSLVTIASPAAGSWRFTPASVQTRVWSQLGIDIRPDETTEAPTLSVVLTNAGEPIDEPRANGLVTVEATLKTLYGSEPLSVVEKEGAPLSYVVALGSMALTADDEVTVRAVGKTFERSRAYTERVAHPIDVDVRDAGEGNAAASVTANIADMDAASLRVLGSIRSAAGRVKLVVGAKQSDGSWVVAIPGLGEKVDVGLKVLFNSLNKKENEVQLDVFSLGLPLPKAQQRGFDAQGHAIVDPVRPPPVVEEQPDIAPDIAAAQLEQQAAAPAAVEPTAPVAPPPTARALAIWEWIAMGSIGFGAIGLLAWGFLRSRPVAASRPLDTALAAYRAALAAATKPPAAATT
jgi:hypothetical protein